MKKIAVFVMMLSMAGCVSTEPSQYDYGFIPSSITSTDDHSQLTNIEHVYVGMTMQEIESIMGDSVDIGYVQKKGEDSSHEVLTIKSPYRKEVVKKEEHRYEILYYFINIKNPDGKITNEELTPLVFEREKLIGKGYDFLSKIMK